MCEINDRSQEITDFYLEPKLEQIIAQLSQIQSKLDRLTDLPEQVDRLEEKLLRVSNIYRYESLQNLLQEEQWLEVDKEISCLLLAIAVETDKP